MCFTDQLSDIPHLLLVSMLMQRLCHLKEKIKTEKTNINQIKLGNMVFHVPAESTFQHRLAPLDAERTNRMCQSVTKSSQLLSKQENNVCWPVRGIQFKLIEELIEIKTDWSQLWVIQTLDIFSMTLWSNNNLILQNSISSHFLGITQTLNV